MTGARVCRRALVAIGVACLAARTTAAQGVAMVLDRAMRDELARSMTTLRLGQLDRPYFIAYRVTEQHWLTVAAARGSLLHSDESRTRMLSVVVRVGDYVFDNTNALPVPRGFVMFGSTGMSAFGASELPLDDNYLQIRRQIWLATDAAYKEALEMISAKRAARLNQTSTDSLPDFTREAVTHTTDGTVPGPVARASVETLVRALSAAPELEALATSSVRASVDDIRTYYVNSEGTTYTTVRPIVTLSATASTPASDGMPLSDYVGFLVPAFDSLPGRDQLVTRIRTMAARLDSLRTAPVLDRYTGPVLFESRAAAQLFADVFAPALIAHRRPVSGDARMDALFDRVMGGGGTSFADKIGARVLPAFLSVTDDPTIAADGGRRLLGGYRVDDDGVPGRRTTVVDGGILKTLLAGRTPARDVPRSTGNQRSGGVKPSNLIVGVTDGVADTTLRQRLLALARQRGLPYAVVIRGVGGGSSAREQMIAAFEAGGAGERTRSVSAYRLYPDGHEERVRGAQLTGMGAAAFRDAVAASATTTVYNREATPSPADVFALGAFGGARGGSAAIVSYVLPALLFEDVSLVRSTGNFTTPPLSPAPTAE